MNFSRIINKQYVPYYYHIINNKEVPEKLHIHVRNLPTGLSNVTLNELAVLLKCERFHLMVDNKGNSLGTAFLDFKTSNQAHCAKRKLTNGEVNFLPQQTIEVYWAIPNTSLHITKNGPVDLNRFIDHILTLADDGIRERKDKADMKTSFIRFNSFEDTEFFYQLLSKNKFFNVKYGDSIDFKTSIYITFRAKKRIIIHSFPKKSLPPSANAYLSEKKLI
ncbi:hypothetical protein PPL_06381 [Heterostelium album PN500]|uniref:RRM domain-containing protein n=1 Tax=Heterostelium pallidum (strain ATCC 26659 / Pp 5 / PN500) TaxID=670386 RepID=D3BD03_HETP5|nr:hypothetical protein PPL_06381 [Heterostelium album PN500]EFA80795.1 hypothetical protein PPL_06381 [Heterostelium album PN500]|eukprot:XP_020432914.1 hypothetical protein PPL_06381 [Heterostelium album PN500]